MRKDFLNMGYGKVRPKVDVDSILGLNPPQEKEEGGEGSLSSSGVQDKGTDAGGVKGAGEPSSSLGNNGAAPRKRGRPSGSRNRVVGERDRRYEFRLSSLALLKLGMVAVKERLTVPGLLVEIIDDFFERSPKARFLKDIEF